MPSKIGSFLSARDMLLREPWMRNLAGPTRGLFEASKAGERMIRLVRLRQFRRRGRRYRLRAHQRRLKVLRHR